MSQGFGRIEYDGNVIEFTRPWTDFQATRPVKSSNNQADSGIEETLFSFSQWFINARLNLLDPQEKAQLQRLFEYAQDGGSFTLIRNRDMGAYINFDGGINPIAAPRGLKTNDDVDGTFTRTNVADSAWYLDEGTGLLTLRDGADVPRFPAGKFGAGIQIDGVAANLIDKPSGPFDADNWGATNLTASANTGETLDPNDGSVADKLAATSSPGSVTYTSGTPKGNNVAVGVWLKCNTGTVAGNLAINSTGGGADSANIIVTDIWQLFTHTADTSGFTAGNLRFKIEIDTNGEVVYAWGAGLFDIFQFYPGTVGALSTSVKTRNAEKLTFLSANIVNRDKGSVLIWIKPGFDPTIESSSRLLFETGDSAGALGDLHVRLLYVGTPDRLNLQVRGDNADTKRIDYTPGVSTGITQDNSHHVAMTWDATVSDGGHIYVGGVELSTGSSNSAFNISETGDTFAIGSRLSGANYSYSAFDDILITKNVLTAAEIAEIHSLGIGLGVPRNRWTVKLMNPNFNPKWLQSDIYDIPMAFKEVIT